MSVRCSLAQGSYVYKWDRPHEAGVALDVQDGYSEAVMNQSASTVAGMAPQIIHGELGSSSQWAPMAALEVEVPRSGVKGDPVSLACLLLLAMLC
jgi:hypothetical protein